MDKKRIVLLAAAALAAILTVVGMFLLWHALAAQPVGRAGATALILIVGVVLFAVGVRGYDAIYDRARLWQRDDIQIEVERKKAKIHILRPDSYGRLGIAYDGKTYRDLDTLATFSQTVDRSIKPVLEMLRWQHSQLTALSHAMLPSHIHIQSGDQVLPTGQPVGQLDPEALTWPEAVDLDRLLAGKGASLDRLVIGAYPTPSGLQPVTASLHDLMHVLCVGASGWGKSSWLRAFLYQIALAAEPCEIVALDARGSALNSIRGWGKLRFPLARNDHDACAVLGKVRAEIDRRKDLYEHHPHVENLAEYNASAQGTLSPWVVVADEATSTLKESGMGDYLRAVVQTARQYGIYVLLAGQSAKSDVIDTGTRDQFSSRICFRTSPTSSRAVLDTGEAGQIHDKGRAIAQLVGQEPIELQGPWVSKDQFIKSLSNGGPKNEMPETITENPKYTVLGKLSRADVSGMVENGQSPSAISYAAFGYSNGNTVRKVQEFIRSHDDDDHGPQGNHDGAN